MGSRKKAHRQEGRQLLLRAEPAPAPDLDQRLRREDGEDDEAGGPPPRRRLPAGGSGGSGGSGGFGLAGEAEGEDAIDDAREAAIAPPLVVHRADAERCRSRQEEDLDGETSRSHATLAPCRQREEESQVEQEVHRAAMREVSSEGAPERAGQ
ncbi:MAG: hypothetical protein JXA90_10030, partial [Planctomycetes bacterium]|nr:hypothetical protein [Planctomycetota bacterium]